MIHSTEDELLAYALDVVPNDEERASIEAHLADCPECRLRLDHIRRDIEVIGGVRPRGRVLRMPRSRLAQTVTHAILRAAAFVVVGFLVGLAASSWTHREPVFVSPSYVTLSPPADHLAPYAVSDATDIPAHYYEQMENIKD